MKTSKPLTALETAFASYVSTRFDAPTVALLSRSQSYWQDAAQRWTVDFQRTPECLVAAKGMPLPALTRALSDLAPFALVLIFDRFEVEAYGKA